MLASQRVMRRMAVISARVHELQVDTVLDDADSPWYELRDTITNYGVRYNKGRMFQKNLAGSHNRLFVWQRPKSVCFSRVYEWDRSTFKRETK